MSVIVNTIITTLAGWVIGLIKEKYAAEASFRVGSPMEWGTIYPIP